MLTVKLPQLFQFHQVPRVFREDGIISGYRHPRSSAFDCVLSSFQMTNETVNIWTHFLPTWYFLWRFLVLSYSMDFRNEAYTWPLLLYMLVICLYPFTSSCAHTFSSMSAHARHICYFLDYGALSLYSFEKAVEDHTPDNLQMAGNRPERNMTLEPKKGLGVQCVIHEDNEKSFFFTGHSHQLFHVCAIVGTHFQMEAILTDMSSRQPWLLTNTSLPSFLGTVAVGMTAVLGNFLIIGIFTSIIICSPKSSCILQTSLSESTDLKVQ
ncbi:membrane progestin receptor delta-like [Protopterus annectens]|uniref:membrane progestin receptor delta-like n=1 Tax=Protopterus annectens TaxID=7888 RepID=UPI001CFBECDE|nr:membrane progestin receptor delta-like [Protopterus annectens]